MLDIFWYILICVTYSNSPSPRTIHWAAEFMKLLLRILMWNSIHLCKMYFMLPARICHVSQQIEKEAEIERGSGVFVPFEHKILHVY